MKTASPAELRDTQPSSTVETATPATPATQFVTVYTFYVYDHDQGKTVIYPRMAKPATIAKMRGKMNEESAWVVDAGCLDIEGFYSGQESTGNQDSRGT